MIWIDYIIIGIIIFSALMSLIRGFVREALSLGTWFFAFFISNRYYDYLEIYFTCFEERMVRNGIAIILLFMAILIVGAVANYVIALLVERTGFSGTDRLLGVCFGLLRGTLIVSVSLFFFDTFTSFSYSQDWKQSQLIPQFSGIIKWIFHHLQSSSNFLETAY